jgi:molybdenum cofactor synthesis domain-containing protein
VIPLAEARAHVLARLGPLPVVSVPLGEAVGAVVGVDVVAPLDLPPFDNAAVDGFAVRHLDVATASEAAPVVLPVVATRLAGDGRPARVEPGTCVRVMTGAPMPAGADAMVMVEDSRAVEVAGGAGAAPAPDGSASHVALSRAVPVGAGVRSAGSDVRRGAVVAAAGAVVGPALVGVLASLGADSVAVHRRPRVGVLSTGDELVPAGQPLGPGQIHDSNRYLLLALVAAAGAEAIDLGCAPDDRGAITEGTRKGVGECDAVLTSGGVSMGDVDLVRVVLDELGDMRWMQIAIKPAKPFAFGVVDETPVFGLPGNPVSSLVSFHVLALPGLRLLAGHPQPVPPPSTAVAGEAMRRRADGKDHLVRVTSQTDEAGRRVVRPVAAQGSHQLVASVAADALVVLPDGPGCAAGELVEVIDLQPPPR